MTLPVFDLATNNISSGNRASASFAHTCTGSDLVLLVFVASLQNGSYPNVSGITYNGVALTKQVKIQDATSRNREFEIWSLIGPATGSNTVAVTWTSSAIADWVGAISFTGVSAIGANGSNSGNSSAHTSSVTTTAADSLVVGGGAARGADTDPFSPGTGVTERADGDTGGGENFNDMGYWAGERPATTTGTYPVAATAAASDYWLATVVELKAVAAAGLSIPVVQHHRQQQGASQ